MADLLWCSDHNETYPDDGESMCRWCESEAATPAARAVCGCVGCGAVLVAAHEGEDTCGRCLRNA